MSESRRRMGSRTCCARRAVAALAAVVALALAAPPPAPADTIELTRGRTIEGIVVAREAGRVVVLDKIGVRMSFPESEVLSISSASDASSLAGRLEVYLSAREFSRALAELSPVLESPDDSAADVRASILAVLGRHRALVGTKLAALPSSQAADLIAQFEALLPARPLDPDTPGDRPLLQFRAALAQWRWGCGQFEATLLSWAAIPPGYFSHDGDARGEALDELVEMLALAIKEQDAERAGRVLAVLESVDPEAARAGRAVHVRSQILLYRRTGDFGRALRACRDDLRPLLPHLAESLMEDTLALAGHRLRAAGDWAGLLQLTDEYASLAHGQRAPEIIAALYEEAGRALLDKGDIDTAVTYFRRLGPRARDRDAKLLALANVMRTRMNLSETDFFGHYRLGVTCVESGLMDEAEQEFRIALASPSLEKDAQRELDYIARWRETDLLARATEAHKAGRYFDALDLTTEFAEKYPRSDLAEKIKELSDASRREISNTQVRRPHEAIILFENAERDVFVQRFDQALAALDRVLLEYADTPAAAKAADLKGRILDAQYARGTVSAARPATGAAGAPGLMPDPALGAADASPGLREEVAFIRRTIGSRLPDDPFATEAK